VTFDFQIPLATAAGAGHGGAMTAAMATFILQLAVVMIAAKLGGLFVSRVLKLPDVIGELGAGMVIGPYALGGGSLLGLPPLFPPTGEIINISQPLYGLSTVASVLLLFMAGLETNLKLFLRYSTAGIAVGVGGVVFSFFLGAGCAVGFGVAEHLMDPGALFLGVISTATSVGITARILAERRKTDTPEGVTIMAAAVLDDVLGIVLLAVVIGMVHLDGSDSGSIAWGAIGWVAAKAFGFWLVCTALGIVLARRISGVLKTFRSPAAITTIAFGLALLLAALSEKSGLAMIIGAYIMGLSLSTTDLAQFLQEQLKGFYNLVVPVFFCIMGMLVDVTLLPSVLGIGLAYTALATVAKVFGCGLPALATGFTLRGAARIGVGMLPRGEVSLIIAGMGLSAGVIDAGIFGTAIMMTVLTTLIAPPLLVRAFHGPSGVRDGEHREVADERTYAMTFPTPDIAEFVHTRIIKAFHREEFFVHTLHDEANHHQIRKDDIAASILLEEATITLVMSERSEHVVRFIVLEELLAMEDVFEACKHVGGMQDMGSQLLSDLYR
jgi:Kef-type K+ transport system membrane component KefB